MNTLVQRQDVTEVGVGEFATEASTLRIPPGASYPKTLKTTLGNKLDLHLSGVSFGNATYTQEFGSITLKVFND